MVRAHVREISLVVRHSEHRAQDCGRTLEALGEWMGFPAYFTAYGGAAPPRSGAHHATIVPYGPFRAGDGGTIFLSVQNAREFARFCEIVLGDAALATDPRFATSPARFANRDALHAEIERVFSTLSADQVVERLEAADIANARLNGMNEFWRHPQLAARSSVLNSIATHYVEHGQPEKAGALAMQSLEIIGEIRDESSQAAALANLSEIFTLADLELSDAGRKLVHDMIREADRPA